jgi:hypothetical protein
VLTGAASASAVGGSAPAPRKPAAGEGAAPTRNPGKPAASGDTDSRHLPGATASGNASASASADGSMSASTPR